MASEDTHADSGLPSVFAEILKPGSSRNPVFLLIVDGALALLLSVLLSLLYMTSGNVHIIALITIECCLWGSIKWFLHELRKAGPQEEAESSKTESKKEQ
ncbi:hypothetical protein BDV93DRAFT_521811 [Ceratobasidium sp. AG-I]|nr:hypothetical protein BDV93DRAFT_521811 [Ceratobasidium sp. AG-I]